MAAGIELTVPRSDTGIIDEDDARSFQGPLHGAVTCPVRGLGPTYELKGYSAKEAEKAIHQLLRPYHVALKVTGPDGRAFAATEWFRVDRAIVDAAVTRFLSADGPSKPA